MMWAIALCLAWCLTDCGAISWPANPEADVVGYIVRVQGVTVAQVAEPYFVLPPMSEPTEFNVVAVDAGGQESVNPRRLLVDPDDPATFMQVDCVAGSCEQFVCEEE